MNENHFNNLNIDWLDPNISPAQNFYLYANGGWIKQNNIPDESSGLNEYSIMDKKNMAFLHRKIMSLMDKNHRSGSAERVVTDFYFSGMDESKINQIGINPLKPELLKIQSIETISDLISLIAHLQLMDINALFSFSNISDFKNNTKIVSCHNRRVSACQGARTNPSRARKQAEFLKKNTKYLKIPIDTVFS